MNLPNNAYRTSDTTLAAFLITAQYELLHIDYSQPRFEFSFPESATLKDSVTRYITGSALTDPASFARVNRKLLRVLRKRCQWEED